jgi:hypothetical protein
MAKLHCETKVGGAIVVRDVKTPKKPYKAPSFEVLDINAAKAQLDAEITSKDDEDGRQMLSLIKRQLEEKKSTRDSASLNLDS